MEHSVLWPLEKMSALLWVSLESNPLSYHPKHRLLSIKHLHPALSDSKVDHTLRRNVLYYYKTSILQHLNVMYVRVNKISRFSLF